MNKAQFIDRCLDFALRLNLSPTDFYVVAGGALLMHGLRTETNDADAVMLPEVYNALKPSIYAGKEYSKEVPGHGTINGFNFSKSVSTMRDTWFYKHEMIEGIQVQTLEEVLVMKQRMNRPKDQEDIKRIKAHIKNKGH